MIRPLLRRLFPPAPPCCGDALFTAPCGCRLHVVRRPGAARLNGRLESCPAHAACGTEDRDSVHRTLLGRAFAE